MFYVAPLFLIALLRLDRARRAAAARRPRSSRACVGGRAAGVIPYERFIELKRDSDTLALLPLW